MLKTWKLLGFDPGMTSNPFEKKTRRKK
jgi:hypothetical protein